MGGFVPNVVTYWDNSDTAGISEIGSGYADAAVFQPPHFPRMLNLVQNGQLGLLTTPTLLTDNFGFNLHIDLAELAVEDSNPINIPVDAFAYEGLRATLEYAYPYQTAQSVMNVIDGIDNGNPYGGFLPSSESLFDDCPGPVAELRHHHPDVLESQPRPRCHRWDASLVLGSSEQLSFGSALRPRACVVQLVEPAGDPDLRLHFRPEHQRSGARLG